MNVLAIQTVLAAADSEKILGAPMMDGDDFSKLLVRFSFNLLVTLIIARGLYYRNARRSEYVFTFLLISSTVFLLCFLLESVKLELGFALGLFAIFGIIRYRTDAIPIKEMTYLFVLIGVAVVNALSNKKVSYAELGFANFAIIALLAAMEASLLTRRESKLAVVYEKMELLRPERRVELLTDLKERTGLDVIRVEINELCFLRDSADILIIYRPILKK